ncbi:MAG: P22AR C-terminal domain-containing protein, partial [Pasteurellaceae bacterium]|nr:P22AR C-terminal domain-containing protein [Pasteurellaceae bacterium]
SRYGVEAYTHWSEYQTTLGALQRLLVPMLAEFEADPMQDGHFHKALKTLREYKPHGLGAIVRI